MNREVPEGLNPEVCKVVLPIRDALVAAGWTRSVLTAMSQIKLNPTRSQCDNEPARV